MSEDDPIFGPDMVYTGSEENYEFNLDDVKKAMDEAEKARQAQLQCVCDFLNDNKHPQQYRITPEHMMTGVFMILHHPKLSTEIVDMLRDVAAMFKDCRLMSSVLACDDGFYLLDTEIMHRIVNNFVKE